MPNSTPAAVARRRTLKNMARAARPATASAHHLTGADLIDCAYPDRLLKAAEDGEDRVQLPRRAPQLSAPPEVAYKDKVGWTVLFEMAYSHDWPRAAAAVIERGCDVHAREKGQTALHWAGGRNRMETARVLLEHGADRSLQGPPRPHRRRVCVGEWPRRRRRLHRGLGAAAAAEADAGDRQTGRRRAPRALPAPASPTLAPQRHRDRFAKLSLAATPKAVRSARRRRSPDVADWSRLEPTPRPASSIAGLSALLHECNLGDKLAAAAAWCEAVGADSVAVIREVGEGAAFADALEPLAAHQEEAAPAEALRGRSVGVAAAAEPGAVRVAESAALGLAADDARAGLR